MAQQPPVVQEIIIEDVLKGFITVEGATSYLVFNGDGIPIKKSATITNQKALHIAALVQDLWNVTKKVITNDLKSPDNSLELIRIRTKHYFEYIITQSSNGDATLISTQDCVVAVPEKIAEIKQVIKEAAQKEVQ